MGTPNDSPRGVAQDPERPRSAPASQGISQPGAGHLILHCPGAGSAAHATAPSTGPPRRARTLRARRPRGTGAIPSRSEAPATEPTAAGCPCTAGGLRGLALLTADGGGHPCRSSSSSVYRPYWERGGTPSPSRRLRIRIRRAPAPAVSCPVTTRPAGVRGGTRRARAERREGHRLWPRRGDWERRPVPPTSGCRALPVLR